MASWGELEKARPDLTEAGLGLLYQFGVGLAFLGTVRPDGGPRVHPICPQLLDDELYAFIVPSPKREDLVRDGRFALHSFACPNNEDAVYLTGVARQSSDPEIRERLTAQFMAERAGQPVEAPDERQMVFIFDIDRCMVTRTTGHGDPDPQHTVWRSTAV